MKQLDCTLNPKHEIYNQLKEASWWHDVLKDKDLYVEVRKDNVVNIYYNGASVAKISYGSRKGLVAEIHKRYINPNSAASGYRTIKPFAPTKQEFEKWKKGVEEVHGTDDSEDISEAHIQGAIITGSRDMYLDSEFQYNKDGDIGKLRIDLVKVVDNQLVFVELKRIGDGRLLTEDVKKKSPEILEQMGRYSTFIRGYRDSLLTYYKMLHQIKTELGLLVPPMDYNQLTLCDKPYLRIENTYVKSHSKRKERIVTIQKLLDNNDIDYDIPQL